MILFIIFVILLLILVNAFYVAAEFAAVSVRRNMIREMAEGGSKVAVHLLKILENTRELEGYIAACQFGITISSLILGAYGQVQLSSYLLPLFERFGGMDSVMAASVSALVVLVGLTVFQVILGELMPKSLALQFPRQAALYTYYPMRWTLTFFAWFIDFLNGSGLLLLKLFRLPPGGHQHIHSQQEINMLLDESHEGGLLEEDEHERLHSALSLAERTVEQIMIPRFQLVCLDVDATQEDILDMISGRPHTHIPIYEGNRESVIGMLHIKDMVAAYTEKGVLPPLRSMLRQVPCVMEMQTVEMLMSQLREEKAKELGVKPMATWVAGELAGVEPRIMGIGPVAATRKVMKKAGYEIGDFDLIEANEAFAAQSVAVAHDLGFNNDILNVNGGAIALGHPVGASGCRILVTLLHEMEKRDAKKGLATLCVGGGMGCAAIVERE